MFTRLIVIGSCLLVGASCTSATGPDADTSAAPPSCRYIPSTGLFTFTANATVRSAPIQCSYDRGTNVLMCRPTQPTSDCSAIYSATYRHIDDFIEEGHVVGKLNAMAQTGLGLGDVCSDGAFDATVYTYDAQHRLLSARSPSSSITYSNWDASGRPRASVQTSGGPALCPITSHLFYDDTARVFSFEGETATTCPLPITVTGALRVDAQSVVRTFNTKTTLLLPVSMPLAVDTIVSGTPEQVCR